MAVSPQLLDENLQKEADGFEKKIDLHLSNSKLRSGGTLTLKVPEGMSYLHLEIIRGRYIKAGWKKVEMKSDQREGTWLEFTS
jgi:hypothetical protein